MSQRANAFFPWLTNVFTHDHESASAPTEPARDDTMFDGVPVEHLFTLCAHALGMAFFLLEHQSDSERRARQMAHAAMAHAEIEAALREERDTDA